jgi:hypothetical protein
METFINIINCCYQEETQTIPKHLELQVPIAPLEKKNNQKKCQIIIDKSEQINIESTNLKTNSNNITINTLNTLNNNNNNNNTNNSNYNTNNSNNNTNINEKNSDSSSNSKNKHLSLKTVPSKKRVLYSNSISHNHLNINKIINLDSKKGTNSIISKSNASKNKSNNTIITLNDLILINQNQEEKNNEIIGSKLLLSGELIFWKDIIISSNGIKNSLRKEKDDHVYFGIKNITNKFGEPFNDLIINFFYQKEDSELVETNTGTVFEIFYNKSLREYILRFLHPNLILYYKINTFVYFSLGREYYFLLGNIFMSFNVRKLSPIEKIINIKVEIDNNKPMIYSFSQNQAPIRIGRSNGEINIFNSSISKKHAIIEYSKNSQSFYFKDMGSTNGSTLIVRQGDTLKIKGEMNFKLEDVPFKIQEIP